MLSLTDGLFATRLKEIFPPMPTKKMSPSCVSTATHLIVAGGRASEDLYLNDSVKTIEILDIENVQWSTSTNDLPCEAWSLEMTLNDDSLYLYYENVMLSCSVENLIKSCVPYREKSSPESMWTRLVDIPVRYGAALATYRGCLLVINALGALHCYNKATNSWSSIGKMPTPRYDLLVAVLSDDVLVVTGGNKMNCLNHCAITETVIHRSQMLNV